MHILFLDESGTPPASALAAKGQKYFVIGGLTIPAAEWKGIAAKLHGLKTRYSLRGELKWRFFAPGNDDIANPMRALAFARRAEIRREMLGIVTSVRSVKVIAAVASIPAAFDMPSVNDADDLYRLTYKTVSERFQYYLQDLKQQTGSEQCGLVVCDHRGPDNDRALRAHHQRLTGAPGMYTSTYPNFIETILFAPSHMSTGLQFADMVAGSVWRKFERQDDQSFNLIESSIRRSPTGVIDGFGIIKVPKRGWR
jgi:Protein of unknown function (DUF3800)